MDVHPRKLDTYEGIEGPITVNTTMKAFEEHADEVAQYLADIMVFYRAEVERNPSLKYCHLVRNGNEFYSWEEYEDIETLERLQAMRFLQFRTLEISEKILEPPDIRFYATNTNLPPPSDKARQDTYPVYEPKDPKKKKKY